MSRDALETLRSAGANVDALSSAQRQVFAELSPEELTVVSSIQQRLSAVSPDVTGQDTTNNFLC